MQFDCETFNALRVIGLIRHLIPVACQLKICLTQHVVFHATSFSHAIGRPPFVFFRTIDNHSTLSADCHFSLPQSGEINWHEQKNVPANYSQG